MNINTNAATLELKAGQVLALDDARGTTVKAKCGALWITEEGNPSDIVLGAGEGRVISRGGRTLIQAMKRTWVSICQGSNALEPTPAYKPIDEFLYDVRFRMQTRM
jgi:hypothetical protein